MTKIERSIVVQLAEPHDLRVIRAVATRRSFDLDKTSARAILGACAKPERPLGDASVED
jgi:hypothetical protein